MNRITALARSPLMALTRFDHPAHDTHQDPAEERAGFVSVSFVEDGGFALRIDRARHRIDDRTLFVTWPDLVFSCAHPDQGPPQDVCLTVGFDASFAAEVMAAHSADVPASPVAALTNRLAYLRRSLLVGAGAGTLALETLAAAVLAEILRTPGAAAPALFRRTQLAWYAARVDAARERMEALHAEPHSLRDLARDAGMSPFHFARVFRERAGTPPHRYLRDLRLRYAAARIRQGASVTEACFSVGFANLGNFTRSFHRAFGVPPSRFAR